MSQPALLVIAHRGASGYRPEHTRAAYELAIALGADAIEPDIVATRDGVLVLRHENEISGTTDVARRPEFASRRATRDVDGAVLTGWFTEDFTWAELATLRATERLGSVRQASSTFDGRYPLMRFRDLLELLGEADDAMQMFRGRAEASVDREVVASARTSVGLVAELKHASHFAELGLPLDELLAGEFAAAGWSLDDERIVTEAFEPTVLDGVGSRGVGRLRTLLVEATGAPADLVRSAGSAAPAYDTFVTAEGLAAVAGRFEGISVGKGRLVGGRSAADAAPSAPLVGADLVGAAHAAGLAVYTWTLRPENRFLAPAFRRGHARAAWGDWLGEFTEIIRTGVDGVFADHPDLAVEARAALTAM